jgi:hypothetical protein
MWGGVANDPVLASIPMFIFELAARSSRSSIGCHGTCVQAD